VRHYSNRVLQAREGPVPTPDRAARSYSPGSGRLIQGFRGSYKWVGSKTSIARQIGNAVPIALGKAIGKHLESHRFEWATRFRRSAYRLLRLSWCAGGSGKLWPGRQGKKVGRPRTVKPSALVTPCNTATRRPVARTARRPIAARTASSDPHHPHLALRPSDCRVEQLSASTTANPHSAISTVTRRQPGCLGTCGSSSHAWSRHRTAG